MGRKAWVVLVFLAVLISVDVFSQVCPTVAVMIPETVIIERIPRRIPDPAAETAVIKRFLEYGFNVVDLVHIKLLRATEEGLEETEDLARRAMAGDQTAIRRLAARDGVAADILVVGEAVSTVTVFMDLVIPGQPRVQDGRARVEVRAIEVATGRILAADALHTGGIDFTAELAGKKSLEIAGKKIACALALATKNNYLLPEGCIGIVSRVPPTSIFNVLPFDSAVSIPNLLTTCATCLETELSERDCKTAHPLVADNIVTGTVAEWNTITTPQFCLWRGITHQRVGDVRVLNLDMDEFEAFRTKVEMAGIEVSRQYQGISLEDTCRALGKQIAARVRTKCFPDSKKRAAVIDVCISAYVFQARNSRVTHVVRVCKSLDIQEGENAPI